MKQSSQASKRRQSLTQAQSHVPQLPPRPSIPKQPIISDFTEDRKSVSSYRCECCRNKPADDYLRERREKRKARENRERKRSEADISSQCSHHSGYHSSRDHESVRTVESKEESSLDGSEHNLTPRQKNKSRTYEDFLIRASPVNELKPAKSPDKQHTPSRSPLKFDSGKKEQQTNLMSNELFSIKEVEQSASFGERSSLLENQQLNFDEQKGSDEAKQMSEIKGAQKQEKGETTLRIMMRYKGALYERTWKNKQEYIKVLEKVRSLFEVS